MIQLLPPKPWRTLLLGRRYNRTKKQGARTDLTSDQNDTKLQTAEVLAQQHGVSPATVKRAGQYAAAIDTIARVLRQHLHARGGGFVDFVGSPPA